MEQTAVPIAEQVKDVVQAVAEALRVPKGEEISPLADDDLSEADALRAEMIRVGRKLWERQYVDGNGGNISVRLGSRYLLCTPTLLSKGDLEPADLCLTDMEGNVVAGERSRTSELLLHLAIYKANPRARAVLHCHPPYATAFALTGSAPPVGLIPEYEIFVGPAAVAPYETPGTQAFADTVLPFVQDHNTILLQNHGIVCWADTVTHAEWQAEIMDTYCKTCLLAQQIGKPLTFIPESKIEEILALKQRMGYPDPRIGRNANARIGGVEKHTAELEQLVEKVMARQQGRE